MKRITIDRVMIKIRVLMCCILGIGTAMAQETELEGPPPPSPPPMQETIGEPTSPSSEPDLVPPPRRMRKVVITTDPDSVIVDFPDVEAQFLGGTSELQKYIMANMQYPQEAVENHDVGRIYVMFIVERDGSLTSIEIERGAAESLNREALRIVQNMPPWIPATWQSKPVRSYTRLPVSFNLGEMKDTRGRRNKRNRKK